MTTMAAPKPKKYSEAAKAGNKATTTFHMHDATLRRVWT